MESHETLASLKFENVEKYLRKIRVRYFYLAPPKKTECQCRNKCLRISNYSKKFYFNKCKQVCSKK